MTTPINTSARATSQARLAEVAGRWHLLTPAQQRKLLWMAKVYLYVRPVWLQAWLVNLIDRL